MITYPSGTTAPFPNSREIGNLFLTNSLVEQNIAHTLSSFTTPNAGCQARLKAEARYERTLEAVACTPLFGAAGRGVSPSVLCLFLTSDRHSFD